MSTLKVATSTASTTSKSREYDDIENVPYLQIVLQELVQVNNYSQS